MQVRLTLIIFLFSLSAQAQLFYKVKKGDSLSLVLYSLGFSDLWGNQGSVKKYANATKIESENDIFAGEKLYFEANIVFKCNVKVSNGEITIKNMLRSTKQRKDYILNSKKYCENEAQMAASVKEGRKIASTPVTVVERFGRLIVVPQIGFTGVASEDRSNGEKLDLASASALGLKFTWQHVWNKKDRTRLRMGLERFEADDIAPRTIVSGESKTLPHIAMAYERSLTDRFDLEGEIQYGKKIYLYAPSTTELQLLTAGTFSSKFNAKYRIMDIGNFFWGVKGGLGLLSSADLPFSRSKNGSIYEFGFFLFHKKSSYDMFGELVYQSEDRSTGLYKQYWRNIQLSIGFSWDVGKDSYISPTVEPKKTQKKD